ncbi:MAG: radical SAM family heme chaperone HemW [Paracoccaceae bacterium]
MDDAGFGLYVHWPFCQAKCPYCDFNSHVSDEVDQTRWRSAYLSEIKRISLETGPCVLNTIFFGGGTPSLMDPDSVDAIISAARAEWQPANDMEITLEANPTSVEAGRFQAYKQAGVNRVSVGVQALNDVDLKALGRLHSVSEARQAFDLARKTFKRVSFDLIYARQHQTLSQWKSELSEALSMAADHVSLYQLTIEDGTAFGDRAARGRLAGVPDDDTGADMYEITQEMTENAGLSAYEVSNHAKPGAESRHNLIYWQSGQWAGIGPGAHGRLNLEGVRTATETHLSPLAWLKSVEDTGSGESTRSGMSAADVEVEALMMGLRLSMGIPKEHFPDYANKFNKLIEDGFLSSSQTHIHTSRKGRPLLNAILRELLA